MLKQDQNALVFRYEHETLRVEPWGKNALRVRATMKRDFPKQDWALIPQENTESVITIDGEVGTIQNGEITCVINRGTLQFLNAKKEVVLAEQWRGAYRPVPEFSPMKVLGREYRSLDSGDYHLVYRLDAYQGEKLFGMGQYQDGLFDKKGSTLELAQRNSQVSVPFVLSNRGYGFLWNNPAIGRATFATNRTEWEANSTEALDFWITADETPAKILQNYLHATGLPPMMPDYAMGFWQCKLRYRTQEEVLEVAREYKRRGVPLDVIVIDFFHWTKQGEWKFDPRFFPDPDAMVKELKEMGIETMVSVWPTVDDNCENTLEMREKGYLIHVNRGAPVTTRMGGTELFYDATNPDAREYIWQKVCQNYFKKDIKLYWLDAAEPEYFFIDYDNYTYQLGPVEQVGNIYPQLHAKAFYDGLLSEGIDKPLNLIRSAWAGSQRYGALVWSGDIGVDFPTLTRQVAAGLSMAVAGIPWWTTDIGGFNGGDQNDPAYRELLIRWFEWGTYCPVMRLHGSRMNPPEDIPGCSGSGGPNEIWSYGDEAYEILKAHIFKREALRGYIKETMKNAHEQGTTVMAPLFMLFPSDQNVWEIMDEFMLGNDLLVAPVLKAGQRERYVYLPEGADWVDTETKQRYAGGQTIVADAPLTRIPTFARAGSALLG